MLETIGLSIIGAAAGAAALTLALRHRHDAEERRATRAGYFDACLRLFDAPLTGLAPSGFARVSGRYQGRLFDLQAVTDTLTYRKLPVLWLLVTIPAPMPVGATLNVMVRPTGAETFSHFGLLPIDLDPARGLPPDTVMRTDDPAGLPPESFLDAHLALFESDRVKELVIAPKGLRITYLAEEADRGRYLLFRDSEMGKQPLSPATLRPLLERLVAMAFDLDRIALEQHGKTA